MKRALLRTPTFTRAVKAYVKRHPDLVNALNEVLRALADDAHAPALRTHKLKGRLSDRWACSVEYDVRIIFRFIQHEGGEAILLLSLGTHDEVY